MNTVPTYSYVPIQAGAFQYTIILETKRLVLESRVADKVVLRSML